MFTILFGLIVGGAGAGALWHFLPRDGVIHPVATMPLFESILPIGIVSALAVGGAIIVSGLMVF